jgi:thiol-disulfide isomerase/thioredoxin
MSHEIENIKPFKASEFQVKNWVDASGKITEQIYLSDFIGKFKVVFCFQSWCAGCHRKGFPDLKNMIESLKANKNVQFLAIQTVFEGYHANTFEKMLELQKRYDLKIPFGHVAGKEGNPFPDIMTNYKTGGTPWFLFIDKQDNVVFSDFHLRRDEAIEFLKTM